MTAARAARTSFAAGALIGAEVTTGGTWDGTDDLVVTVWVLLRIDAI